MKKSNNKNKNLTGKPQKTEKTIRKDSKPEIFGFRGKSDLKLERTIIESIHAIASSKPPKPKPNPKPMMENINDVGDVKGE